MRRFWGLKAELGAPKSSETRTGGTAAICGEDSFTRSPSREGHWHNSRPTAFVLYDLNHLTLTFHGYKLSTTLLYKGVHCTARRPRASPMTSAQINMLSGQARWDTILLRIFGNFVYCKNSKGFWVISTSPCVHCSTLTEEQNNSSTRTYSDSSPAYQARHVYEKRLLYCMLHSIQQQARLPYVIPSLQQLS